MKANNPAVWKEQVLKEYGYDDWTPVNDGPMVCPHGNRTIPRKCFCRNPLLELGFYSD
jgi:hypothetical protein